MDVYYHLKLDGITGESSIKDHVGEIQLTEWSLGAPSPARSGSATGGPGKGQHCVSEISCTARISKATPSLFEYCAKGKEIKTAKLTVSRAGSPRGDFLIIDLEKVGITSHQTRGVSDGQVPLETFSLNFVSMTMHHVRRRRGEPPSSVRKSWDRGART